MSHLTECKRDDALDILIADDAVARYNCIGKPLKSRTIEAPPGAGKSTLMLRMVEKHPGTRFRILTFSKDLQTELAHRARDYPNVQVSTYDALCFSFLPQRNLHLEPDDATVSAALGAHKAIPGIADIVEYIMRSPVRPDSVTLCPKHRSVEASLRSELRAVSRGRGPRFCSTFAGLRYHLFHLAHAQLTACDALLVDEAQDLEPQALLVLTRLGLPVTFFQDRLQTIYGFSEQRICLACRRRIDRCAPTPQLPEMERLYVTHRLSPRSCAFLQSKFPEHFFGVSAKAGDAGEVQYVDSFESLPPGLLVLTRTNLEAAEMALAHDLRIAGDSRTLRACLEVPGRKQTTALRRLGMTAAEAMQRIERRSAHLHDAHTCRVVSTVHRAKGFETDFVLVPERLIPNPKRKGKTKTTKPAARVLGRDSPTTELCISFVALSRHRERLFVLKK